MPRFTFQLEPLLMKRQLAEQEAQRAVAVIARERSKREVTLRQQQQRILQHRQSLQATLVGTVDVPQLRFNAAASLQTMREAQRMALELAGLHRRLEAARAILVETSRQRRMVERLKELRFEQWKLALEKAETNALDELAVIAAARADRDFVNVTLAPGIMPR